MATLLRKIGNLTRKRWFLAVEIYFATRFWGFLAQEVTRNSKRIRDAALSIIIHSFTFAP